MEMNFGRHAGIWPATTFFPLLSSTVSWNIGTYPPLQTEEEGNERVDLETQTARQLIEV